MVEVGENKQKQATMVEIGERKTTMAKEGKRKQASKWDQVGGSKVMMVEASRQEQVGESKQASENKQMRIR